MYEMEYEMEYEKYKTVINKVKSSGRNGFMLINSYDNKTPMTSIYSSNYNHEFKREILCFNSSYDLTQFINKWFGNHFLGGWTGAATKYDSIELYANPELGNMPTPYFEVHITETYADGSIIRKNKPISDYGEK
jgi:hypothetical protein